jgi:hypothetical protein
MTVVLLAAHVLAGILFVGPSAVVASIFPRDVPIADPSDSERDRARSAGIARALHRISRGYGLLALTVPALGIVLAIVQGRITEVWVLIAMGLTAVAGALLAFRIVPAQAAALAAPPPRAALSSLGALAGVFNLLWVAVVVLMIARPGSAYHG